LSVTPERAWVPQGIAGWELCVLLRSISRAITLKNNDMSNLFLVFLLASIVGLGIGLIKPSIIKLKSRKVAGLIFGGCTIVFFVLFGITAPPASEANPAAPAQPQTAVATPPSPVDTTTSAQSGAVSSTSGNPFNNPQQNDALFISAFTIHVTVAFDAAGSALTSEEQDLKNQDYRTAITDMQNVQYYLQHAQTLLSDAVYGPLTPDVDRINTLANEAVISGLKGAGLAITDMENANYDKVANVDVPYLNTMVNDYTAVRALIAGWQAKQGQ
jgi:hypothetical protein